MKLSTLLISVLIFCAGFATHWLISHHHKPPAVPPPAISYDTTIVKPEPPSDPVPPSSIVLYKTVHDTIRVPVIVPMRDTVVYAVSSKPPTIEQHGMSVTLSPLWIPDSLRYVSLTYRIKRPSWGWGLYATAQHDIIGNSLGLRARVRFKRVSLYGGLAAYSDAVRPSWGLSVRLVGSE